MSMQLSAAAVDVRLAADGCGGVVRYRLEVIGSRLFPVGPGLDWHVAQTIGFSLETAC